MQKKVDQRKQVLTKMISQQFLKVTSRAFRKIQIYEKSEQNQTLNIRHYDLECQAVSMLQSILQNKIQALLIKGFIKLKAFNTKRSSLYYPSQYQTMNQLGFGNARLSYQHSRNLSGNIGQSSNQNLLNIKSQAVIGRSYCGKTQKENYISNNKIAQYQKKIKDIMNKVKAINENPQYSIKIDNSSKLDLSSHQGNQSRINYFFSARRDRSQKNINPYSSMSPSSSEYIKFQNPWTRQQVLVSPFSRGAH